MSITVQQIIDQLMAPAGPLEEGDTADTLKSGRPDAIVRKAVVAMTATYDIIQAAVTAGADLLVVHEPTYYNHKDDTAWLSGDRVFEAKRKLIEDSGIAIFRFHDYMHAYQPDPIVRGMLRQLGWLNYADTDNMLMLSLPETTVGAVAAELKQKLGIGMVKLVGDANTAVRRACFMPGAPGGEWHIRQLGEYEFELLIAGETNEWETNEYVRDAVAIGEGRAMLVIGHHESEEAGMREVVEYLQSSFPGLPVEFLAGPSAATFL